MMRVVTIELSVDDSKMRERKDLAKALRDMAIDVEHRNKRGGTVVDTSGILIGSWRISNE